MTLMRTKIYEWVDKNERVGSCKFFTVRVFKLKNMTNPKRIT